MSKSDLKVLWTTPGSPGTAFLDVRRRMENIFRDLYGEVLRQKEDPEELLRDLEALEAKLRRRG